MQEKINEQVSVVTIFDRDKASIMPVKIKWQGKIYPINKLGYHHNYRQGRDVMHIFSVANNNLAFRLRLDSSNLRWILEEISDGQVN